MPDSSQCSECQAVKPCCFEPPSEGRCAFKIDHFHEVNQVRKLLIETTVNIKVLTTYANSERGHRLFPATLEGLSILQEIYELSLKLKKEVK